MKTSERLYEKVADIWEGYLKHPFVQGIADGSLAIEKFQFFMIQDHLYLMQYAKVFALGILKAEKESDMRDYAHMAIETLDVENAVHQAYLKKLGITKEMIGQAKMSLLNESYTNYMISIATKGGLPEIATAVMACSWSYEKIGEYMETLDEKAKSNEFYGPWIEMYSSKEYKESNNMVIDMLDRFTQNCSEEEICNLERIIINCSRYEQEFWDMSWEMKY